MTEATKAVITAAINADPSMTRTAKDRIVELLLYGNANEPTMRFFTAKQAASVFGCSPRTVKRMVANGRLKTRKINGRQKITVDSVYAI